jgi:hypothetical protein
MLITRNALASSGWASMSTLATLTSWFSAAICSTSGPPCGKGRTSSPRNPRERLFAIENLALEVFHGQMYD